MKDFMVGVGLRPPHYPYLETKPKVSVNWFEAISENYMDSEGRPRQMLLKMREDYPIGLHGVSLSIGSSDGVSNNYLERLKNLIDVVNPFIVSDHICWTGTPSAKLHDLLPLPFTKETIDVIVQNTEIVQSYLRRRILLENASTYMTFKKSEMPEWEFIVEIARKSGCKLLLDINNIYVNSRNHNFDPYQYIRSIPREYIGQIHLAGHTDHGDYLFDTHSAPVTQKVWDLFKTVAPDLQNIPVLIEWDAEIPAFEVVEDEAKKALSILVEARR